MGLMNFFRVIRPCNSWHQLNISDMKLFLASFWAFLVKNSQILRKCERNCHGTYFAISVINWQQIDFGSGFFMLKSYYYVKVNDIICIFAKGFIKYWIESFKVAQKIFLSRKIGHFRRFVGINLQCFDQKHLIHQ